MRIWGRHLNSLTLKATKNTNKVKFCHILKGMEVQVYTSRNLLEDSNVATKINVQGKEHPKCLNISLQLRWWTTQIYVGICNTNVVLIFPIHCTRISHVHSKFTRGICVDYVTSHKWTKWRWKWVKTGSIQLIRCLQPKLLANYNFEIVYLIYHKRCLKLTRWLSLLITEVLWDYLSRLTYSINVK